MTGKTEKEYAKDYTEPALRVKLKNKIKQGSKGGKAGQWSARKSQLLTKLYTAQGGDYLHKGRKTAAQKNLKKWGNKKKSS